MELTGIEIIGIISNPSGGLYKHCLFFSYQCVILTILKWTAQYNYLTSNLYFAIICRCRTATPLHNSLVYYQATNNMIVLVVIAPASAIGAWARHQEPLPLSGLWSGMICLICLICLTDTKISQITQIIFGVTLHQSMSHLFRAG